MGARRRRHRKIREWRRQLIASTGETSQQCGGDLDSRAAESMTSSVSVPDLPQDILLRIHSLMSMREAARAASVSQAFLHSWRCHSDLIFNKDTISLKKSASGAKVHHKIDRILRNHAGISLRRFELDETGMCGFNGSTYLDSWLQVALKPGVEELTLLLSETKIKYSFPCSFLSDDGVRNSLRHLKLNFCDLRCTAELGPLRSLTSLQLSLVSITWDQLECLLSNSLALEKLDLTYCSEITCLKIPCVMQQLSSLSVLGCSSLKVIESKAPNLSSCFYRGHNINLDFSLVETLQLKKLDTNHRYFISDARAKLPSIMPNLESLVVGLRLEAFDAPMLPTKFLYLKHLAINVTSGFKPDYISLVSFLDASPSLETLILKVFERRMSNESVFEDSQQRQMHERRHSTLKSVEIRRFSPAKSLVELTCYILENALSLERLTLDTTQGSRCDKCKFKSWSSRWDQLLLETARALSAIRSYIEYRVPSTVELTVTEPCSRCLERGRELISSQRWNNADSEISATYGGDAGTRCGDAAVDGHDQ